MTDQISPDDMTDILELIYSGQKISAVKRYMDVKKTSLLDAKQFIEQLTSKLKEESSEKFAAPAKSGCLAVLIAVAVSWPAIHVCASLLFA